MEFLFGQLPETTLYGAGFAGVILGLLFAGKQIILTREKTNSDALNEKRFAEVLAEKDRQIADLKNRVKDQSEHIKGQDKKLEERNLFIQKTQIELMGEVIDRQVQIIEMQAGIGVERGRDKRQVQIEMSDRKREQS